MPSAAAADGNAPDGTIARMGRLQELLQKVLSNQPPAVTAWATVLSSTETQANQIMDEIESPKKRPEEILLAPGPPDEPAAQHTPPPKTPAPSEQMGSAGNATAASQAHTTKPGESPGEFGLCVILLAHMTAKRARAPPRGTTARDLRVQKRQRRRVPGRRFLGRRNAAAARQRGGSG